MKFTLVRLVVLHAVGEEQVGVLNEDFGHDRLNSDALQDRRTVAAHRRTFSIQLSRSARTKTLLVLVHLSH